MADPFTLLVSTAGVCEDLSKKKQIPMPHSLSRRMSKTGTCSDLLATWAAQSFSLWPIVCLQATAS